MDPLTDAEIVKQMKACYYEKYKTLVRMHLSFELELNTDEFDLPSHEIVYEDKGKLKKWNRLSKKHKVATSACATTAKSAGNSPTEGLGQQIDAGFIFHLAELKEFLMLEKNIQQEGIFRKTGSSSRQNELRLHIQNEEPLNLNVAGYSAHDCATVFKSYLAELTEPLLTDAHYPAHLQIAPLCIGISFNANNTASMRPERIKREQRLLNSMQYLLLLLPDDNRSLLIHIIDILNAVIKHESINKMSAENLATLFAPHLICPRNLPPEALHYLSKKLSSIIAYMINKGAEIFETPAKLLTDIKAYFLCKRKKTVTPEKTLDDSISDISTVNTVYTFVDRERTAAAHTANTTDTELAQLYAHIQSLPESSKKRRLIKQFNKQNGQGTPLQLVIMNRLKNSEASRSAKSISDSIKKHIFHKGIMSRTPKRSNAHIKTPTPIGVETPNFSNPKQPKLRVLFQSPVSSSMQTPNNVNNTTTLKTHPLQKSISSTSLLLNSSSSSQRNPHANIVKNQMKIDENELSNSTTSSASYSNNSEDDAQQKHKIDEHKPSIANTSNSSNDSVAIESQHFPTTINAGNTKKSVVWHDEQNIEELKSRYKSEPNLSSICINKQLQESLPKTNQKTTTTETAAATCSKSLTRKLIKGVSMGNLKFPLVRSVSAITKRRHSDEVQLFVDKNQSLTHNDQHQHHLQVPSIPYTRQPNTVFYTELEDLDDHTFETDSNDHIDTDSDCESESENDTLETALAAEVNTNESTSCDLTDHGGFSASEAYKRLLVQPTGLYRNIDLITSTPALLLGRRSMSPITKSAQRMPRSMQESIMTPRSRKPVMILTTTSLESNDQNRTSYQSELSNFSEQDDNNMTPIQTQQPFDENSFEAAAVKRQQMPKTNEALSDDFKKYLRSRSVFTESPPGDSSFSSHSDDFKGDDDDDFDEPEIQNLRDSELSPNLLYCLDGNEPALSVDEAVQNPTNVSSSSSNASFATPPTHLNAKNRFKRCCDSSKPKRFDNALKRGATTTAEFNKENEQIENEFSLTKKMLMNDFPNETSF